jgi:hypothetical protein
VSPNAALRFAPGSAGAPAVTYRLAKGEDAAEAMYRLLCEYEKNMEKEEETT